MVKKTIDSIYDTVNSFNRSIIKLLVIPLLFIPVAVLFIYSASEGKKIAQLRIKQQAEYIMRTVLLENRRLMEESEAIMGMWSEYVVVNRETPCDFDILPLVKGSSRYLNYGVLDLDGDLVCSGEPFTGPINAADRLYFQKVLETKEFSVGEYQIGRVTGRPSVNFGYPVLDMEGNVIQVLYIAFDLEWLGAWVNALDLPSDTELLITDYKGAILVRHPDNDDNNEDYRARADFPMHFSIILSQREGAIVLKGDDGIERVYAYAPLNLRHNGDPASFVLVGISEMAVTQMTGQLISKVFLLFWLVLLLDMVIYYFILRKSDGS